MYSPDGFASLACLVTGYCDFLGWQAPFVELMKLFYGNVIAFFVIQAITWFALIGSTYFLAKQLKINHLFLTPFLLIFGGSLFVDNYVGSLENDYMAIVLFVIAMIFWFKGKNLHKFISVGLVALGTSTWVWVGYFRLPRFFSYIAEENWWVQIMAWGFLTPIYLTCILFCAKKLLEFKDNKLIYFMGLLSFCFPKLWFFVIPAMLLFIDFGLNLLQDKKNFRFWITIIVFGLTLGQVLRVSIYTFEAWSYTTDSNCYLVNHEYLARIQGKSLNYNQASIYEYNRCLQEYENG